MTRNTTDGLQEALKSGAPLPKDVLHELKKQQAEARSLRKRYQLDAMNYRFRTFGDRPDLGARIPGPRFNAMYDCRRPLPTTARLRPAS